MRRKSDKRARVVSATEASRTFSALLDRVEKGDRFLIERRGKRICAMGPPPPPPAGRRASDCLALLRARTAVELDGRFGEDLLAVIEGEPAERRPWES